MACSTSGWSGSAPRSRHSGWPWETACCLRRRTASSSSRPSSGRCAPVSCRYLSITASAPTPSGSSSPIPAPDRRSSPLDAIRGSRKSSKGPASGRGSRPLPALLGWEDYETVLAAAEPPVKAPAIAPRQTAFLPYTSGSTGRPKGVLLAHDGMLWGIRHAQEYWPAAARRPRADRRSPVSQERDAGFGQAQAPGRGIGPSSSPGSSRGCFCGRFPSTGARMPAACRPCTA